MLFGDGLLLWFLLMLVCMFVSIFVSICFCFVLYVCLWCGVCELGGSFAGGCASLAISYRRMQYNSVTSETALALPHTSSRLV